MKVLFLDVDGVLNKCGRTEDPDMLEQDKLLRLKRICAATNCRIVVSSTWRGYPRMMDKLCERLRDLNISIMDRTPCLSSQNRFSLIWNGVIRGDEIAEWLNTTKTPVEKFVIVDDNSDMGGLIDHLVQTYSFTGLTDELADEIIDRLK